MLDKISTLTDTIYKKRRQYAKYREDISEENACNICYETVRDRINIEYCANSNIM